MPGLGGQLVQNYHSEDSLFPIDIYKRVFVCKSGHKQKLQTKNEELTYVGIGRIGDRKGRSAKRFIQEYERREIKNLLQTKEMFDVLITHDKDDTGISGYGMPEIRKVLDNVLFHYHFYGHTGEPFKQETDRNGITQAVKVNELKFDKDGFLGYGCMVILSKENGKLGIEVVDQSLINKLTRDNWKAREC